MALPNVATNTELRSVAAPAAAVSGGTHTHARAISWGAIIAGAAAAAALSLILLILGTGLGLSTVSPWSNVGIGATAFGVTTILWVTLTQVAASGMGGYIAGRLRGNWAGTQADEIYFRDTAHGFLAWAVATLTTAALLTTVIGAIVSGGIQAGATVASGVAATAGGAAVAGAASKSDDEKSGPMAYFVDSLFRKDVSLVSSGASSSNVAPDIAVKSDAVALAEVTRIFVQSIRSGPLPLEDVRYVGKLVTQRTGLSQPEAEKRVTDTYTRIQTSLRDIETTAKQAADKARKASAYSALWLFISLLIGAFFASLAAVYGGRHRDL